MIETLYRGNLEWLVPRTILFVRHGSQAYGTALPTSDTDYKGIAIPPARYFHGFSQGFEQAESHSPDMVVYDIRKFFKLAADCNPNIIEVLYSADEDVLVCAEAGQAIRNVRRYFLSKKARHTFSGYAMAQLKRIKTHRRWLLTPPKERPSRKAFDLPEQQKVLSPDQMGAFEELVATGKLDTAALDGNFLLAIQREKSYLAAAREWEQYENWKKTRNPGRADIEAKYGYDTKHAMHLVRLMRMCAEILTEATVIVKRPDAAELLEIRNGAWSYERLMGWAEEQDARLGELAESSPLRHGPDTPTLDALCAAIVEGQVGIVP